MKKKNLKLKILLTCIIFFAVVLDIFFIKPIQKVEGPIITIESPLNQTYHAKNIILNVSTNETALWIGNSFDNGQNVTECYNCTGYARFDLFFNNGVHTITVYASVNQTRISKARVTFTVNI
jgi:hypothetical protein